MSTQSEEIQAQIGTLREFLESLSDDNVIERHQLEHRIRTAEQRLTNIRTAFEPKRLPITFRGKPVDGIKSIDAAFGADAIKLFVEATDTVAASLMGDLSERGRLPGSGRTLRIVDTALGSFGFELELPAVQHDEQLEIQGSVTPVADDAYERAIDFTLQLLDQASSDDEDAISEIVADVHPRAATKVRAFAKLLSDNGALFAARFQQRSVRLERDEQVQRILTALDDRDIEETVAEHAATIIGILPESRVFEARLEDGSILRGKIDSSIADIHDFKRQWENKLSRLSVRVIRVRSNSRYRLTSANSLD